MKFSGRVQIFRSTTVNVITTSRHFFVFLLFGLLGTMFSTPLQAQTSEAVGFFRQNCVSCHTIGGGRLTGPDLKNVTQRKDPAWLIEFLTNPQAMIDRGDPYALKLQQDARGVVMPTVQGMTRERAATLLNRLDAESKLPKSQFAG